MEMPKQMDAGSPRTTEPADRQRPGQSRTDRRQPDRTDRHGNQDRRGKTDDSGSAQMQATLFTDWASI